MSDSVTITREWMELLDGIADAEERWKVLSAVFLFANTDNAKKTDMTDGLTPIGECVFMSICERLMKRKRDNHYITKRRHENTDSRRNKTPTVGAKNTDSRRSDDLFDLSSNQHIDTFKPPLVVQENYYPSPRGEERKKFVPPTLEEVREYCQFRRNAVDPEEFHAYYTANN